MQQGLQGVFAGLRRPEYTGENRCYPCTLLNVAIALVIASTIAIVTVPNLGIIVFLVAVVVIYFRGYLIPYTPTVTKRYFPDRILAAFDKADRDPEIDRLESDASQTEPIDPETTLLDAGVIEPCDEIDDLCLDPSFQDRWRAEMADILEGDRVKQLAEFFDITVTKVHHLPRADGHVQVYVDGDLIGKWESDAAIVADLAGATLLEEYVGEWDSLPLHQQSQLASGVRAFLERCPACDEELTLGEETVESCCRSREVYAITCESCEKRLLEIEH